LTPHVITDTHAYQVLHGSPQGVMHAHWCISRETTNGGSFEVHHPACIQAVAEESMLYLSIWQHA
jgi:hypothetical protein